MGSFYATSIAAYRDVPGVSDSGEQRLGADPGAEGSIPSRSTKLTSADPVEQFVDLVASQLAMGN